MLTSTTLDFNSEGKKFATSYIQERIIGDKQVNKNSDDVDGTVQYIFNITELLCLLTLDQPLPSGFIDKFARFLIDVETGKDLIQIPYDYIAYFIYNNAVSYDHLKISISFSDLVDTLPALNITDDTEQIAKIDLMSNKIKRHIQLAIYQKNFIEKHIDLAGKKVEELDKKAKSLDEKVDSVDEKANTLLQDIYSSFITILGIFSAIIVAVFGGITITGASLSKIEDTHSYLLFLSTGLISLFLIIYFLFTWIHQIKQSVANRKSSSMSAFFLALVLILLSGIAFYSYKNKPSRIPSKTNTSTEYKLSIEAIDSK